MCIGICTSVPTIQHELQHAVGVFWCMHYTHIKLYIPKNKPKVQHVFHNLFLTGFKIKLKIEIYFTDQFQKLMGIRLSYQWFHNVMQKWSPSCPWDVFSFGGEEPILKSQVVQRKFSWANFDIRFGKERCLLTGCENEYLVKYILTVFGSWGPLSLQIYTNKFYSNLCLCLCFLCDWPSKPVKISHTHCIVQKGVCKFHGCVPIRIIYHDHNSNFNNKS